MIYHRLKYQASIAIPAPIIQPSIAILRNYLTEKNHSQLISPPPLSSTLFSPSNPVKYFRMPVKTKPISTRRETNSVTHPLIEEIVEDIGYCPDILKGITSFKRMNFLFTCSSDAVLIYNTSACNNSNDILTLFIVNMVQRKIQTNLDAFITCIVAPDRSENPTLSKILWSIIDHTSNVQDQRSDCLHEYDVDNTEMFYEIQKSGCPSGDNYRQILAQYLKAVKDFGKRGFIIRLGSTLLCIKYAIKSFIADLPASNELRDSNMLHNSSHPCPHCDVSMRYFSPAIMKNVWFLELCSDSPPSIPVRLKTINSAMLTLPKDDLLRLLPLAQYLRLFPDKRNLINEYIQQELQKNSSFSPDDVISLVNGPFQTSLDTLLLFVQSLPSSTHLTLGPEDQYVKAHASGFQPTNPKESCHAINVLENTFLTLEGSVCHDLMHCLHNVVDIILKKLFFVRIAKQVTTPAISTSDPGKSSKKKKEKENSSSSSKDKTKKKTENDYLNNARAYFGMPEIAVNYTAISASSRNAIQRRWATLTEKQKKEISISFLEDTVDGGNDSSRKIAAEKIRFAYCFLPFLTIDCMDDPQIWCLVSHMGLLSSMYNHSGSFEEMEELNVYLHCVGFLLEEQTEPSFTSVYHHNVYHISGDYHTHGPMQENNTLHSERQYRRIRKMAEAGRNPSKTLMNRITTRKSCEVLTEDMDFTPNRVIKYDILLEMEKEKMGKLESDKRNGLLSSSKEEELDKYSAIVACVSVIQSIVFDNIDALKLRAEVNWLADLARYQNDLLPVPSFSDIEFCGGYIDLANLDHCPLDTNLPLTSDNFAWSSSITAIENFLNANSCDLCDKYRFEDVEAVNSFRLNNVTYESLKSSWKDLTLESFTKKAFGLFMSVHGVIHLMGIHSYLFFHVGNSVYIQALVYEIPIHPCVPVGKSPFSFLVDLEAPREQSTFTLISLHRLYIETMFITPVARNEIYCTPNTSCIRQWKVFNTIEQSLQE